MGWDYGWQSRQELIDDLRARFGVLRCTVKREHEDSVLWALCQVENKRVLGCILLARADDGVWGYKAMDEAMEPYYWSCPVAYLDEAPVACERWRAEVRRRAAARARKLAVGDVLDLPAGYQPARLRIVEVSGRRVIAADADTGHGRYRVTPRVREAAVVITQA